MSTALAVDSCHAVAGLNANVDCSIESYINSFRGSTVEQVYSKAENKFSAAEISLQHEVLSSTVTVASVATPVISDSSITSIGNQSEATELGTGTDLCSPSSASIAAEGMNMSGADTSICGSPERRNIRKNPKPVKNRGSERLSENCEPLSGSENKFPSVQKRSKTKASPLSANPSETGRGKRIRKPTMYARFLESSTEDGEKESVKRIKFNQGQESDKKAKSSVRRSNTGKLRDPSSSNEQSENGSLSTKPSVEDTPVNGAQESDQSKNITSFKNILTKNDANSNKTNDHHTNGHVIGSSSSCRAAKSVSPCSSRASKSTASPTQSRRSKRLENQEGKCMQLSVTNEDGEVEDVMVTIVDIDDSSSDEEHAKREENFDSVRSKQSPKVDSVAESRTDTVKVESNSSVNVAVDPIVLSDDEKSVLSMPDVKTVSVGDKTNIDTPETPASKKRSAPKSTGGARVASGRKTTGSTQKRKRKSAFEDDGDYNCNSKEAERLSKRYGCKTAKRLKKSAGGRGRTKPDTDTSAVDYGPYIHVVGPKLNPVSCRLKNSSKDGDSQSSVRDKKTLPNESFSFPSGKKFLASSPWACIFCGHGSTHRYLGDLFGPYYSSKHQNTSETQQSRTTSSSALGSPPTARGTTAAARGTPAAASVVIPSETSDSVIRRRKSRMNPEETCSRGNELGEELPEEMWLHMECCVWTGGVYVSGGRLRGLEEAADIARKTMCCQCSRPGATLGCYVKGCKLTYHYLCAVDAGGTLQDENFTLLCSKHKEKGKKLKSCQST